MTTPLRRWWIAGFSLVTASLVPNAIARAQGATITGTVTSERGVKLQGANIRIPSLRISVGTNGDGVFVIQVPEEQVRGQTEVLQVRAIGYLPSSREVVIRPGTITANLALTIDSAHITAVVMAGGQPPKQLAYTVNRVDSGRALPRTAATEAPSASVDGAFERLLFAPELIMRFQQRIQLTEQQRSTITAEIARLQSAVVDVQWKMSDDTQKLIDQLQQARIDETTVVAQLDRITASEALVKRSQLMMLVRIRNVLTAGQQETLRGLRSGAIR